MMRIGESMEIEETEKTEKTLLVTEVWTPEFTAMEGVLSVSERECRPVEIKKRCFGGHKPIHLNPRKEGDQGVANLEVRRIAPNHSQIKCRYCGDWVDAWSSSLSSGMSVAMSIDEEEAVWHMGYDDVYNSG